MAVLAEPMPCRFVRPTSCDWFDRCQCLQDMVEESPGMIFDESDSDDEL